MPAFCRGVARRSGNPAVEVYSFCYSEEGVTDQLHDGPTPPGQPGGHGWSGSAIFDGTLLALLRDRLSQFNPQALVIAGEVITSQPPEKMFAELSGVMGSAPRATRELRDALTNSQVGALNK